MNLKTVLITAVGVVAVVLFLVYTNANSQATTMSNSPHTTAPATQTMSGTDRSGNGLGGVDQSSLNSFDRSNNTNGSFTAASTTSTIGRAPGIIETSNTSDSSNSNLSVNKESGIIDSNTSTDDMNPSTSTPFVTGQLGVRSALNNQQLPANASVISEGEVVGINQSGNTISVRESVSGPITTYSINDSRMLQSVGLGDTVQVFTQAENR